MTSSSKSMTAQNLPDRWENIETAFLQAADRESKKSTQERILEQTKAPFYFLKGAGLASLKLLEKGIQSKFSSWREQIETLSSLKKFLSTQAKKQEALQTTAKNIYQNPRKFLTQISEGFKDQLTQKTVEFLNSPKEKQAEIVGSWAPPLALSFAGGQLGNLTRGSKVRNLSFKSNGKLQEGIGLAYDKLTKTWTTPAGLKYNLDKTYGTTVKHALHHTKPVPWKKHHTLFNVPDREVLPLIDEAWSRRGKPLSEGPRAFRAYVIDMNKTIGTEGETKIRIVVRAGSSEIITAYPWRQK